MGRGLRMSKKGKRAEPRQSLLSVSRLQTEVTGCLQILLPGLPHHETPPWSQHKPVLPYSLQLFLLGISSQQQESS